MWLIDAKLLIGDVDSARVYYLSVEDFEARSEPASDSAVREPGARQNSTKKRTDSGVET